ncbi:MAG: hypothetical protein AAFQ87_27460, partial [Bacteroidota bacterium]
MKLFKLWVEDRAHNRDRIQIGATVIDRRNDLYIGGADRKQRFAQIEAAGPCGVIPAGTADIILSPQQVRGILTSTTDDIGRPGWDHTTGAGRLNLRKALLSVGTSNVQIISPVN